MPAYPCFILLILLLFLPSAAGAEAYVSRAQFAVLLWEAAGAVPYDANGPFADVHRDDDGATAICWAKGSGLMLGTGPDTFDPSRPITREEAAVALRRCASQLGRDTFLPDGVAACNDYADISPWADDSLYWACDAGVLPWSAEGRLDPLGVLTPDGAGDIIERFFSP